MSSSPAVLLPRLGVNVDHVATLRQARRAVYPDPVHAAVLAELGGAAQITVHLREDRRHIQDRDVELLRRTITTRLNLEMAATDEMLAIARSVKPDMVTLVPEKRTEVTTEGGLDVRGQQAALTAYVSELRAAGLFVSLFIDPEAEQVAASRDAGAHAVELHTGAFCEAAADDRRQGERQRLVEAAHATSSAGLRCYAGHGIHYGNIGAIASILEIEELNIGHSIVARAVLVGMERAVRELRDLGWQARRDALASKLSGGA